jgi:hypothetical protein
MTAARDTQREHAFLAEAARGHDRFVAQCEARLAASEDRFGSSWAWIGIGRHLTELLEEAADLGSWAVLADQALDHDQTLSDLHKEQIRAVLVVTSRRGAQAHELLSQALASIERVKGQQT